MEPKDRLGDNIRNLRLAAGLSQMALGNRADMDMAEISRLERGGRDPRLSTIARIAAALEVPIEDLVRGVLGDAVEALHPQGTDGDRRQGPS